MNNLSKDYVLTLAKDQSGSGTTTITTTIDMYGVDQALILTTMANPNAGNYCKLGYGAASDGSDATDIAGSKQIPAGSNTALVAFEVDRPPARYLTLSVVRVGAASVLGPVIAIQPAKSLPVNNNAGSNASSFGMFSALLKDPIGGTP